MAWTTLLRKVRSWPGLGQQLPLRHLDRELAPAGAHHLAARADPVAQVEADEFVETLGQRRQCEQLHRPRRVPQLGEGQPALRARQHDAAGHCDHFA
jgi:hypothetical protein